jgi:hypothetical protein
MGRKNNSRIAWHYCYDNHINEILESAKLLPPCEVNTLNSPEETDEMRNSKDYMSDKRLLLFSENAVWEPASYRSKTFWSATVPYMDIPLLKLEDYAKYEVGVYRIGVSTKHLKPYSQLCREVHMPVAMDAGLIVVARKIGGNPFQWWGSTKPVPQEKWVAIQKYVDGVWVDMFDENGEAVA